MIATGAVCHEMRPDPEWGRQAPKRGCAPSTTLKQQRRCLVDRMMHAAFVKTSRFSNAWSNDIEFSGERKRVRCNEGLGSALLNGRDFGKHGPKQVSELCDSGRAQRTTVARQTRR